MIPGQCTLAPGSLLIIHSPITKYDGGWGNDGSIGPRDGIALHDTTRDLARLVGQAIFGMSQTSGTLK